MNSHTPRSGHDSATVVTPRATAEAVERAAHDLRIRFERICEAAPRSGITHACLEHGLTRGQFARFRRAYERGGDTGLLEAARRTVRRQADVRQAVEAEIRECAETHPDWGRFRMTRSLRADGIDVTPRQVARVLRRWKAE